MISSRALASVTASRSRVRTSRIAVTTAKQSTDSVIAMPMISWRSSSAKRVEVGVDDRSAALPAGSGSAPCTAGRVLAAALPSATD